jgi:hypothetical protein
MSDGRRAVLSVSQPARLSVRTENLKTSHGQLTDSGPLSIDPGLDPQLPSPKTQHRHFISNESQWIFAWTLNDYKDESSLRSRFMDDQLCSPHGQILLWALLSLLEGDKRLQD